MRPASRALLAPFALALTLALAACAAEPAGPRPMPLALDEAPFVLPGELTREELTLRPNRAYVLRRIPRDQKVTVRTGYYDVLNTPGQVVLLDNQTAVRIAFSPEAPIPLAFERLPLTASGAIPAGGAGQFTLVTGQYHVANALLAPRPGEVPIAPLLPPMR